MLNGDGGFGGKAAARRCSFSMNHGDLQARIICKHLHVHVHCMLLHCLYVVETVAVLI